MAHATVRLALSQRPEEQRTNDLGVAIRNGTTCSHFVNAFHFKAKRMGTPKLITLMELDILLQRPPLNLMP
jgi:hypothetical protein